MEQRKWIELYNKGLSFSKIAKATGSNRTAIARFIRSQGLSRTVSESKRIEGSTWGREDEIVDLYNRGFSLKKIQEMTGIKSVPIFHLLKKIARTRTLSEAGRLHSVQTHKNINFFDVIDTEEKAYWLGFITADGWIEANPRKYALGIELNEKDSCHLEIFAKLFDRPLTKRTKKTAKGNVSRMVCVRVNSVHLVEKLIEKNIVPRKSLKSILERVLNHVPQSLQRHFIRGLFDGDGSIISRLDNGRKRKSVHFVGCRELIERIRNLMVSELGVFCPKLQIKENERIVDVYWQSQPDVIKIGEWFYKEATIFLERKRAKFELAKEK